MISARSSVLRLTATVAVAIGASSVVPSLHAASYSSPDETSSAALVEQARATAGVGSLAQSAALDGIARSQAARMAAMNAIFHNPNLQRDADAAGVDWQLIGENVGVGPDVSAVHQGFMASPSHHHNIVFPDYNAIGVGVMSAEDGSVFVAHVFARIGVPAPVAPSPTVASSSGTSVTRPSAAPAVDAPVASAPAATEAPAKPAEPASQEPNAVIGGVIDHMFDPTS